MYQLRVIAVASLAPLFTRFRNTFDQIFFHFCDTAQSQFDVSPTHVSASSKHCLPSILVPVKHGKCDAGSLAILAQCQMNVFLRQIESLKEFPHFVYRCWPRQASEFYNDCHGSRRKQRRNLHDNNLADGTTHSSCASSRSRATRRKCRGAPPAYCCSPEIVRANQTKALNRARDRASFQNREMKLGNGPATSPHSSIDIWGKFYLADNDVISLPAVKHEPAGSQPTCHPANELIGPWQPGCRSQECLHVADKKTPLLAPAWNIYHTSFEI